MCSASGDDRPITSYNKDTDLGTAASRVYFHLKAEAVECESKWSDGFNLELVRS